MKLSIVVAMCLFLSTPAVFCSTTSVAVVTPFKSGRNIRVGLLVNGKPGKAVKVDIYRYKLGAGEDKKPRFSLISDDDGWIRPPRPASGSYHLVASIDENRSADLYLDVSPESNKIPSAFSMELRPTSLPAREQRLAEVEQMPVRDYLKEFHGIVGDISGAMVPGAFIEVVRRGTEGRIRVARLKTDRKGEFHKKLHDGAYIAIFSMFGFQTAYVPFSITKQGSGNLNIALKIAQAT